MLHKRRSYVELQHLDICMLHDIYMLSPVQKEFKKAVDEPWRKEEPWMRYQDRLLKDLAVLDEHKKDAIIFEQFELLTDTEKLYSIRHPKTKKNVRVLYTITDDLKVILLTAFLEKSASDYDRAKKTAVNRLKWLES